MPTIQHQQTIALEILHKLEVVDPYCILAGGAPRDWYLGNPCNDLDFYFVSTASTVNAVKKQLERCFGEVVVKFDFSVSHHEDPIYKTMPFIRRIIDLDYKGMKVQLIQLNSLGDQFKVVKAMSASICKIAWKGGDYILDRDFKTTIASGIMFLSEGYNWSDPHPAKMKERFKGKFMCGTEKSAFDKIINEKLKEI